MFEIIDEAPEEGAVIKVIGVGGCGGVVEHMIARVCRASISSAPTPTRRH